MLRLHNQVAIVTGAAGGIGSAIAARFVDEGARVMMTDLNRKAGEKLQQSLGDTTAFIEHDVSNEQQWKSVVEQTQQQFGKITILVNNAGICLFRGLCDYSRDDIQKTLDINLVSVMLGTQATADAIAKAGGGAIINMSSSEGLSAINGLSAYIASKWAVRGYTKAAAMELGPRGIRVNSIHPGGVNTQMANPGGLSQQEFDEPYKRYPAQRGAEPKQIAGVAAFLASDDASHCMGAEIAVDGGMTAGKYMDFLPGAPTN